MGQSRSIRQVAEETGLSADTLRYYERIGLISRVGRSASGHRVYNDADVTWILFLKQLRATGMSIAQMQHFAQLRRDGDASVTARREMLEAHRQAVMEQIATMTAFVSLIDEKIARHKRNEQAMKGTHDDSGTVVNID